ncbi:MAG: hypothetical protein AAF215_17855 [Cyanobacteria bacterium P01_A01_bin.123]
MKSTALSPAPIDATASSKVRTVMILRHLHTTLAVAEECIRKMAYAQSQIYWG